MGNLPEWIRLRGARVNNLKNINVDIPLKKFTIITGVSGSGKSSLAFDTLYAEGQRRYVESLSTYTRQFLEKMAKPDIDSIDHIAPSIALEQKNHVMNSRSTVATQSELYDYFRVLYSKVGRTFCPNCNLEVRAENPQTVASSLSPHIQKRCYVLANIDPKMVSKKNRLEFKKNTLQQGFERILIRTKKTQDVVEISTLEEAPEDFLDIYLVIDRMTIEPENARMLEAIEAAFLLGSGLMTIALVFDPKWEYLRFSNRFECQKCSEPFSKPEAHLFSFNSALGACSACSGFGFNLELDEALLIPDKAKTIRNGAVDPFTKPAYTEWHDDLMKFCEKNKINTGKRWIDLTKDQKKLIWEGDGGKKGFQGITACFEELKSWKYKLHVRVFIRRYQTPRICGTCNGARLKPTALNVKLVYKKNDQEERVNISELSGKSIHDCNELFTQILNEKSSLTRFERDAAKDVLAQIAGRLRFLDEVGVGYLTLNRLSKTLSGGECQRISLATQLGNKLCSTLYVLDEPSIGLHPADTSKLIKLMHQLRDHGNTLIVVEHDLDVIASADYMIELGPLAGSRGGEVIVQDSLEKASLQQSCLTGKYLSGAFFIEKRRTQRSKSDKVFKIIGASENNLQNVTVEFPRNQLIMVTGLSGSGKTTLIHKTLHNALARLYRRENLEVGKFQKIYGADLFEDVVLLDQKPIGKSARSNPATYLKLWDDVRKIYSNQSLSLRRGYTPQYFSFNADGGRCPICKGEGEITLDMHFMAELKLPCEECEGMKFKKAVLEVEFKKKNIYDILCTTIDECIEIFREYPSVTSKLQILKKVGLGYLQLGQSSTTLSGGESQRMKIASILQEKTSSNMLYIFDEPTTGLHLDDVKKLLNVLHDLVDQKNTVIVIEHNLELIAQADWVIDLGPGGGINGGNLIVAGTPEDVMSCEASLTGTYLRKMQSNPSHRILLPN